MSNATLCGVVLAGGKSSRMGKDKGMLTINGQTLIQRAVDLLSEFGTNQVLISRNNEPDTLQDIYPHQGPLSGIHAALCQTTLDLLVIPVDMPLLNKDLLQSLMSNGMQRNEEKIAASFVHFPIPVFIPNSKQALGYLEQVLSSDEDRSVKRFLRHIGYKDITASHPELLVNVNTPEEWQALLSKS